MTGGALVSLIVFLFLRRLGPTLIIASAIPLSIIVTWLFMPYHIELCHTDCPSLSVGMVVDNGVVAPRISHKITKGGPISRIGDIRGWRCFTCIDNDNLVSLHP